MKVFPPLSKRGKFGFLHNKSKRRTLAIEEVQLNRGFVFKLCAALHECVSNKHKKSANGCNSSVTIKRNSRACRESERIKCPPTTSDEIERKERKKTQRGRMGRKGKQSQEGKSSRDTECVGGREAPGSNAGKESG